MKHIWVPDDFPVNNVQILADETGHIVRLHKDGQPMLVKPSPRSNVRSLRPRMPRADLSNGPAGPGGDAA